MNHISLVDTCLLTKFEGELQLLPDVDDDSLSLKPRLQRSRNETKLLAHGSEQ